MIECSVVLLYELEMLVIEKVLEQIKTTKCRQDIFVNCTPLTLGNIRFTRDLKKLMQQYKNISPMLYARPAALVKM